MKNELVQENNCCQMLDKDAINLVDSQNCSSLSFPPRKSLETPVLVMNVAKNILCYFPRENSWCKLGEIPDEFHTYGKFVPFDGKLYRIVQESSYYRPQSLKQVTYDAYLNRVTELPSLEEPGRYLRAIFVGNGGEMYSLMSEPCVMDHLENWRIRDGRRTSRRVARMTDFEFSRTETKQNCGSRKHTSFFAKYKPETNTWEDVTSFYHLDQREDFCIVTKANFVYFIGGIEWPGDECRFLSDVDRYDLRKNQWDNVANIQRARKWAHGAATNSKIYIAGGVFQGNWLPESCQCEVYDETTNEWQFIRSFFIGRLGTLLVVHGTLYGLSNTGDFRAQNIRIDCYDPGENKWTNKTDLKFGGFPRVPPTIQCSMRIFKGLFNIRPAGSRSLPF